MRNRRLGELLPKQTMFLRLTALDFGRASKTPCAGASGRELASGPTYGTINARCTCDWQSQGDRQRPSLSFLDAKNTATAQNGGESMRKPFFYGLLRAEVHDRDSHFSSCAGCRRSRLGTARRLDHSFPGSRTTRQYTRLSGSPLSRPSMQNQSSCARTTRTGWHFWLLTGWSMPSSSSRLCHPPKYDTKRRLPPSYTESRNYTTCGQSRCSSSCSCIACISSWKRVHPNCAVTGTGGASFSELAKGRARTVPICCSRCSAGWMRIRQGDPLSLKTHSIHLSRGPSAIAQGFWITSSRPCARSTPHMIKPCTRTGSLLSGVSPKKCYSSWLLRCFFPSRFSSERCENSFADSPPPKQFDEQVRMALRLQANLLRLHARRMRRRRNLATHGRSDS